MTVSTAALQHPRPLFPLWQCAVLLLMAATTVVVHTHAVEQHGADAEAIRKCLDDKGPYQLWRSFDGDTFYRVCQLDDDRWGLQAIVKVGEVWHEKTAFIRGDGSWKAMLEYLQRTGTHYRGSLP